MGDQHRSDNERAQRSDHGAAARSSADQRDAEDAQFDPSHARTQHAYHERRTSADQPMNPVHTVEAVGTADAVDTLRARFDAAVQARNAAEVLAIVRDMDTARRKEVADRLDELAGFLPPRDILSIAGFSEAGIAATVLAALKASPQVKREQLRAYFADVGPYHVDGAFQDEALAPALRARFPGSPIELLPQLGDLGGLHNPAVLSWLIDTTPAKVVARLLLAVPGNIVEWQSASLDALGDRGWKWLDAVDAQMAAVTAPATIEHYRKHAQSHAQKPAGDQPVVDDARHIAQLDRWAPVASKAATRPAAELRGDAAALRARRADVIASSSVLEIQEQTEHAGLSPSEQLDWILDKPGLTAAQLRQVTTVIETINIEFSSALLTKIQKRFPKVPVEDLFSGDLPNDLIVLGAHNLSIATWLLAGAAPESTLRIVAVIPDLIDEWCAMLVATGAGFGWVRQLGGTYNDKLLRRFALKCPDVSTREYVETRLLGEGDAIAHDTVEAPVAAPTAYTSNRSHLDADLDAAAKRGASSERSKQINSDTIVADVSELTAAEVEGLRHDAKRLGQVLAAANQKTFAQIIDEVQPALQVVIAYATPANITAAHLMSAIQGRPAAEVVTTLSNPLLVSRLTAILGSFGPLEVWASSATPAVLAPVLHNNPEIIEWLLVSEPGAVIRAFAAPSVIDAAVRALATLDDLTALDAWPSAEALGPGGRSVLVQLHARAKGALREALDAKLKVKLPKPTGTAEQDEEAEEVSEADKNALTLDGHAPFPVRLADLLAQHASVPTVLALCRANASAWSDIADQKKLLEDLSIKLGVAPDVAFPGVALAALLGRSEFHDWILTTIPAFKVLNAIGVHMDASVAATIDQRSDASNAFLDALPRGRGLSAANKTTLHRIARLVSDERAAKLFGVTFDTDIGDFPRPDLEKLWSILERVPHAHVDQHSIRAFRGMAGRADNTTAGVYYPETQDIKLQTGVLDNKTATEYDNNQDLTEEQAIEALGSRADLDRLVGTGRMQKNADGTFSFVRHDDLELFTMTALHEVGHGVDYMLGARTELIYGTAGWKRFNTSDFDGWARDLGGWELVTESDQKEIRKVWISWLRGGGKGTVADLVDNDHPAVATRYAAVGVVDAARLELMNNLKLVQGRYAMAQHKTQEFFTLSEKAYNASPSQYALTAPEEYFAECYANYYREYNGTPETADKKGASLAPWIKTWFDTNIDRTGHNPRR